MLLPLLALSFLLLIVVSVAAFFLLRKKKSKSLKLPKKDVRKEQLSKKLIYTRQQFLQSQPKFYELPPNFYDIRKLISSPSKQERAQENFSSGRNEKGKMRVKALSKGDSRDVAPDEDLGGLRQADTKIQGRQSQSPLDFKQKESLDILLDYLINEGGTNLKDSRASDPQALIRRKNDSNEKANKVFKNPRHSPQIKSPVKANADLADALSRTCSIEDLWGNLEFFSELVLERVEVSAENYHKLALLCMKYELLHWASYLMREMNVRGIEIGRDLLDEFLHLNFVNKTLGVERSKLSKEKSIESHTKSRSQKEVETKANQIRDIWKQLNINSRSFSPKGEAKSLNVRAERFEPRAEVAADKNKLAEMKK